MATFTDAQLRPSFDQKWDLKFLQARYGKETIGKNVLNKSGMVSDSGEVVNLSQKPRITGGVVGADGTFTAESLSLTNFQINVNTWRYVSHIITDKQAKQSIATLETELASQFGERLTELDEIDLADQFLNLTGFNGTAGQGVGAPGVGVDFGRDTALVMLQALRRRQIPPEAISWQLPVEAFYQGWLKDEVQTSAHSTGLPKSSIITGIYGYKQMILGFPAYESTLLNGASTINPDTGALIRAASGVNLPGTTAAALIHEESIGYAFQINAKFEKVRTTPNSQFATLIAAQSLYGLNTLRATHGVLCYIRNGS